MKPKSNKCSKCKHPAHTTDNCSIKILDAAGDSDYCPCQVNTEETTIAVPLSNLLVVGPIPPKADKTFMATITVFIDQPASTVQRWIEDEFTEKTLSKRIEEIQVEGFAVVEDTGAVIYPAHTIFKIEVTRG